MSLHNTVSYDEHQRACEREVFERSRAEKAEAKRDAALSREAGLREALEEAEEYFDQRADAEYFPDSPAPHPNEEMKLLTEIRQALSAEAPDYLAVVRAARDVSESRGMAEIWPLLDKLDEALAALNGESG